jgi:hypothetical protein
MIGGIIGTLLMPLALLFGVVTLNDIGFLFILSLIGVSVWIVVHNFSIRRLLIVMLLCFVIAAVAIPNMITASSAPIKFDIKIIFIITFGISSFLFCNLYFFRCIEDISAIQKIKKIIPYLEKKRGLFDIIKAIIFTVFYTGFIVVVLSYFL